MAADDQPGDRRTVGPRRRQVRVVADRPEGGGRAAAHQISRVGGAHCCSPAPLRTGRAVLTASGSSKEFVTAVRSGRLQALEGV
jgi:hypothetical protein